MENMTLGKTVLFNEMGMVKQLLIARQQEGIDEDDIEAKIQEAQ